MNKIERAQLTKTLSAIVPVTLRVDVRPFPAGVLNGLDVWLKSFRHGVIQSLDKHSSPYPKIIKEVSERISNLEVQLDPIRTIENFQSLTLDAMISCFSEDDIYLKLPRSFIVSLYESFYGFMQIEKFYRNEELNLSYVHDTYSDVFYEGDSDHFAGTLMTAVKDKPKTKGKIEELMDWFSKMAVQLNLILDAFEPLLAEKVKEAIAEKELEEQNPEKEKEKKYMEFLQDRGYHIKAPSETKPALRKKGKK